MQEHLSLRRTPTQARAQQTFDTLLAVTAELLDEVGFEAFNTNLLANRSGIGTRAIYRYFPNKYALVTELARGMASRWRDNLGKVTAEIPPTSHGVWPEIWARYLDAYVTAVRDTRGGIAVLHAMRAHPELRSVDDTANAEYITAVAGALRRTAPSLTRQKARLIATLLLKTTVAGIDAVLDENTANGRRLFDMLKVMQVEWLREQLRA